MLTYLLFSIKKSAEQKQNGGQNIDFDPKMQKIVILAMKYTLNSQISSLPLSSTKNIAPLTKKYNILIMWLNISKWRPKC